MITVVIPTLNEARNVANVVRFVSRHPGVTEVLVIDDGSIDATLEAARAAGARVATSTLLGKGASLQDGVRMACNPLIVCLDGDMLGFPNSLIEDLTRPLISGAANFCKAKFRRSGGRVTTLTANPLLEIFFPELRHYAQPLGGIFSARKSTLERIKLETDYGVDLGMLIDLTMQGELMAEVDVGTIGHDSQPLQALSAMASQVARTILSRAARFGRLGKHQLMEFEETDRQERTDLRCILPCIRDASGLVLIDMDGTILRDRFIVQLANATGRQRELSRFLDNRSMSPLDRSRAIANIFEDVHQETFVTTARQMELQIGVVETIRQLRKLNYAVGIITDSFQIAAETIRRRVFADFTVAHTLQFSGGFASGRMTFCSLMHSETGCHRHAICKKSAMLNLCRAIGMSLDQVIAIGDSPNDDCMLEAAGTSIAFQPKAESTRRAAQHVVNGHFSDILRLICTSDSVGKFRCATKSA